MFAVLQNNHKIAELQDSGDAKIDATYMWTFKRPILIKVNLNV